jgi:hypothetical protein
MEQDKVIYLVNKAKYLLVSWGAASFINYGMWPANYEALKTVIVAHSGYRDEWEHLEGRARTARSGAITAYMDDRPTKLLLRVNNLDALTDGDLAYDPISSV